MKKTLLLQFIPIAFILFISSCSNDENSPANLKNAILWEYQSSKYITSHPACTNELVLVEDNGSTLVALDCLSGKEVWSFIDDRFDTNQNLNASVSFRKPIIDNGIVYWATLWGNVFAIDIKTGQELWHFQAWEGVIENIYSYEGFISGPYLHNDVLYLLGKKRKLIALKIANGELLWESNLFAKLEPPLSFHDDEIIVHEVRDLYPHYFKGINTANGQTNWSVNLDYQAKSSPWVYDDNLCYKVEMPIKVITPGQFKLTTFAGAN